MRSLNSNIVSAIQSELAYRISPSLEIYPSRVFFEETDYVDYSTLEIPKTAGPFDTPVNTDLILYEGIPFQVYNVQGQLKYQYGNDSRLVEIYTGYQQVMGKPSLYIDTSNGVVYVYFVNNYSVRIHTFNMANVANYDPNCLSPGAVVAALGAEGTVHAITNEICVSLKSDGGGIRPQVHYLSGGSWITNSPSGRFMFPAIFDYTSDETWTKSQERTFESTVAFSGAAKLDTKVFVYISNFITGGVDAMIYDTGGLDWSDVITPVPCDLTSSESEFRISNCVTSGTQIYICGQFIRHDNVKDTADDAASYEMQGGIITSGTASDQATRYSRIGRLTEAHTMILRSTTGKLFSVDSFSIVSEYNYRQIMAMNSTTLMLSACFKRASANLTWLFTSTPTDFLTIPYAEIIDISDDNFSRASVRVAAGSLTLIDSPYMLTGNKVIIKLGYYTEAGIISDVYGTYIIDRISRNFANGKYELLLSLVNVSQWQLQGMTSPFYTEIISKASARDDLDDQEKTQLYAAPEAGYSEAAFSVDAWAFEPWDYPDLSITGKDFINSGGAEHKTLTGSHKYGVITPDLQEYLGSDDYPLINSTSIGLYIYGWSYATVTNVLNDEIKPYAILIDPEGTEHVVGIPTGTSAPLRWLITYPVIPLGGSPIYYDAQSAQYPIMCSIPTTVGWKIKKLALSLEAAQTTEALPIRIDVISGTTIYRIADDANTSWYSDDDEIWKLRSLNRPHIMFSRQPYDTFNFQISAEFVSTLDASSFAGLGPCSWGLVGLAQDSKNYTAARFNHFFNRLELVVARDGIETIITTSEGLGALSAGGKMMFEHKDGTFNVYFEINGIYEKKIAYQWSKTYFGWMFTDPIAAKHTGVYGYVNMPEFTTTGYNPGSAGGENDPPFACGIPLAPGETHFHLFPNSGTVQIGLNRYSYSGKTNGTNTRGPFQFRQASNYTSPIGYGWGIQILDMDWSLPDGAYNTYLLAADDGTVYDITNSRYKVYQTTNGVPQYIPGRAAFYASEALIKLNHHNLSTRMYVASGLTGITHVAGEYSTIPWGTRVRLYPEGEVKLVNFSGSSGDIDVTIKDLINHVAITAGATPEFTGDISFSRVRVGSAQKGSDRVFGTQIGSLDSCDGFDLCCNPISFVAPLSLKTNANLSFTGFWATSQGLEVRVTNISGNTYELALLTITVGTVIEKVEFTLGSRYNHDFRYLFHGDFITVYIDDKWIHTFHTKGITYPKETKIFLFYEGMGANIDNIVISELCDWREAIYIDLETDGMSAIGSIIQERPVEINPRYNGTLSFWYDPMKETTFRYEPIRDTIVPVVKPRTHSYTEQRPPKGASDGIVYYSEVSTVLNSEYRRRFGFATRVFRLPNLDKGAVRAAKILMGKNNREWRTEEITMRPDLRIELGDILSMKYTVPGSDIEHTVIITAEAVRLSINAMNSTMTVSGKVLDG